MKHMYEVHTYTLCDGWVNCWSTIDENHKEEPTTFETIKEAQTEIDELMQDIKYQIDAGERNPDEAYDPEDYRIFNNQTKKYVA